uniref:Uncharacterized protein n=1 Tax=Arundo donax TaxID=35708 RepID=A0A0A9CAR5_ARUDO
MIGERKKKTCISARTSK